MPLYRVHAVVLRTYPLGEADRIITMLTPQRGVIRAVAKGVRRTSSQFGSRLEPFSVIDVQCYEGRTLDTVTQASAVYAFQQLITRDYDCYTAGAVMLETTERLAEDDVPSPRVYELLVGALNALARRRHSPDTVVASYLLRVMALAGWAPLWMRCALCGSAAVVAFDSDSGGAVCEMCAPPSAVGADVQVLRLGEAVSRGDWKYADAAGAGVAHEVAVLATRYTQWHVERRLKSVAVRERG